jgi:hypothetical protein
LFLQYWQVNGSGMTIGIIGMRWLMSRYDPITSNSKSYPFLFSSPLTDYHL